MDMRELTASELEAVSGGRKRDSGGNTLNIQIPIQVHSDGQQVNVNGSSDFLLLFENHA
jgi:hypothetical protein